MPRDPFLAAHFVTDQCFEIGGEYSPASIRDQMVRAYSVTDRAFQASLIGKGRDLLVVGAGPSGLTAAVRAADLGVKVVVAERRKANAFLLGACTSRDVEPTLYDWPVNHWARGAFDWTGARFELRWRANRANLIAANWQRQLAGALRRHRSRIDLKYGTAPASITLGALPAGGGVRMVDVRLSVSGTLAARRSFGAVVSCVGFGRENRELGTYSGFRFWETDDFERPNCGLSFDPAILISGGGDGALQDFIRVMTGKGTKQVFLGVLQVLIATPWLVESTQSDLQSAEDVAARALSWNTTQHDAPVFRRLEAAHEKVINRLQASTAWTAISQAVRDMVHATLPNLRLVHQEDHFSQCYPMNRFLTLLILRVVAGSSVVRVSDARVVSVTSKTNGHSCANNPKACHGQLHEVAYAQGGQTKVCDAHVVILRHGILGPKRLFTGTSASRSRQLLPYYVET